MEENKNYPESVTMLYLYQKKSKAGNVYFTGTIGKVRYSLVRAKVEGDEQEPVWALKISPHQKEGQSQYQQRPQYQPQQHVTRVVNSKRDEDEFMSEFMG